MLDLAIKKAAVNKTFNDLETKKQEIIKQQQALQNQLNQITTEQVRLQGEFRLIAEMEQEVGKPGGNGAGSPDTIPATPGIAKDK